MPRHSPYALFRLNFFVLSCLSSHIIYLQWKSIFTLFISWFRLSFDMRPNCSFPRFRERPWFLISISFSNPVKLSVRFSYLVFNEHSFFAESILPAMVGSSGVEPPTSCLSGMRSNLLSYEPVYFQQSFKIEQQILIKAFVSSSCFLCESYEWSCFNLSCSP